jgi:hypothetical protein
VVGDIPILNSERGLGIGGDTAVGWDENTVFAVFGLTNASGGRNSVSRASGTTVSSPPDV